MWDASFYFEQGNKYIILQNILTTKNILSWHRGVLDNPNMKSMDRYAHGWERIGNDV